MKKAIIVTLVVIFALALGGVAFYSVYRIATGIKDKFGNDVNVISEELTREIENEILGYSDSEEVKKNISESVQNPANTGDVTKEENEPEEVNTISEEEAMSIGNNLYKKAATYYWGNVETTGNSIQDGMYMEISNISEIKSVFSAQGFRQFIANNEYISEIDGSYYRVAADRGGDLSYLGNELQVESITDNRIVFNSIEKYAADENEWGLTESQVTSITRKTNRFVIVKENGSWKVEDYTMPN